MCEWLKQAVLKTAVRETAPGVRIPLPPPKTSEIGQNLLAHANIEDLAALLTME
jgi:hypothetical protein